VKTWAGNIHAVSRCFLHVSIAVFAFVEVYFIVVLI